MKKIFSSAVFLILFLTSFSQTSFKATTEKFKNNEIVWNVQYNQMTVGQFWPIHGLNLVTSQTDAVVTTGTIEQVQKSLGGVATAPDGMTGGSFGAYKMQGMSLSNGRPCGDGIDWDYGVVIVDGGFHITFTHHREHNMDSLFRAVQARSGTMFYLPVVQRYDKFIVSDSTIDKVLVRREVPITQQTPDGIQMGVIIFSERVTYNQARAIVTGLDRPGKSVTTHIYVLDGGSRWGQSCKEVNGTVQAVGTRDPRVITNYLVLY